MRVHSEQGLNVPTVSHTEKELIFNVPESVILINESDLTTPLTNISKIQGLLTPEVISDLKRSKFVTLRNPIENLKRVVIVLAARQSLKKDGSEAGNLNI